jgi:hypothetical protein
MTHNVGMRAHIFFVKSLDVYRDMRRYPGASERKRR